ncbi:hypothetical protein [uncultured Methanospirillum sp.]|uniref:hypothetical protein n=1 Tax=uncultured Methanospirillum sp. TaxID=262503 RepID=UPI0029C7EED3|nr:hypothetical protein [uncultured Methanospirillum sp.]
MNVINTGIFVIITLFLIIGFATADRLPNQTPENQVFTINTVVDATGAIDSGTDMQWVITTPGAIGTGTLAYNYDDPTWGNMYGYPRGNVIADTQYRDSILTNGGKLAENKNFDFNSKDQSNNLYNIESQKVLTYGSTEGSHMVGEEEYTLDVAGEAKQSDDNIRCVFSSEHGKWLPPFCNIVSAKSALINVNSAQISSNGQIRAVAATDDIPAGLSYQIAVTPDANSGSGFAEGTVKTTYAGSVMEGRDTGMYYTEYGAELYNSYGGHVDPGDPALFNHYDDWPVNGSTYLPSVTNSWKDSTTVTGGIKAFQKAFEYKSGFRL